MKETVKLTVRLFLITAIAGLVLAFANSFTSPVIKERERKQYEVALKEVFSDADKFETLEEGKLNQIKEKIKNIVVYKARTLAKNTDGNYEPLYKTLTTTFIERTLRFVTTDFKEDKLNMFFSTNPESQKSVWVKDQKFVNGIMQKGDDLSHIIDEENNVCQLNIVFSGNVKNLQVEINKN